MTDAPPVPPPPAPSSAPGPAPAKAPRAGAKPARRRSREFAVQGLYQWLVSGEDAGVIDAHIREQDEFDKCDRAHFDALLHGCIREAVAIDAALARHVDRKTTQLSPVEHAVLMIGWYELTCCIDVPYRVVINEGVELAKTFGGTDGHRYVNGVLDRIAHDLRPDEVRAARPHRR